MSRYLSVLLLISLAGVVRADELPRVVGGSWQLTGKVRATVCVDGHCGTSGQKVNQSLYVPGDEASISVSVIALCPGVTIEDLQGLTVWEPGRKAKNKKWLVMRVVDRSYFVETLRTCSGYPSLRLKSASAKFRVLPGGEAFDLRATLQFSLVVEGRTVGAIAVVQLHGMRGGDAEFAGEAVMPPVLAQVLTEALAR